MKQMLLIACLFPFSILAQADKPGTVSFGVRSTVSLFNHGGEDDAGYGAGGHFRVLLTKRLNTEWFADYLSNATHDSAARRDAHIGWSVMYYLVETQGFERKFTPYVVAGHCFDYTQVSLNHINPFIDAIGPETESRWSSAIQAGLGTHYNLTQRFDVSIAAQYMIHFGEEYHIEELPYRRIVTEYHNGLEGHLLVSLSLNIKL
jgi:opacity protein-like surface antigen